MVNSIKLDDISPNLSANSTNKTNTPARAAKHGHTNSGHVQSTAAKSSGIVVTSHMNQLVNMVMDQGEAPDENARVQAMKAQVQSNQYQVNVPGLADKLAATVLANS